MTQTETSNLPPYLSFSTFQAAILGLRGHGLPDRLDRSAWSNRSGAEQGQIVSGLKFLGLIDKDGHTQQALRDLVLKAPGSGDEKRLFAELLKARYQKVFGSLDLTTATPKQIEDAIGEYGATGATKDRAVRFFIKAAQHAEVPLSSRFTNSLRSRTSTLGQGDSTKETLVIPKTRRRKPKANPEANNAAEPYGNALKTVTLRLAGGKLTLSGTFNPFELEGEERKLVYGIVDLMKAYERASGKSESAIAAPVNRDDEI